MGNCCSNYEETSSEDITEIREDITPTEENVRTIVNPPTFTANNFPRRSSEQADNQSISPRVVTRQHEDPGRTRAASAENIRNARSIKQNAQHREPQTGKTDRREKQVDTSVNQRRGKVTNNFQNLLVSEKPKKIEKNDDMLHALLNEICGPTDSNKIMKVDRAYTLERLNENSFEFREMKHLFVKTNKKCFQIHSIEKVFNPCLILQYNMKKVEYAARGIPFEEERLFHGTKKTNIDGICERNFNWRFRGASKGFKYGQGVSFSPIAYYATHYGDKEYNKVMIVAYVIISECCLGDKSMKIPPLGYDTSVNEKKHVYVKYDDNTFYPAYLIHYGGIDERANKQTEEKNMVDQRIASLYGQENDNVEDDLLQFRTHLNVHPSHVRQNLGLLPPPLLPPPNFVNMPGPPLFGHPPPRLGVRNRLLLPRLIIPQNLPYPRGLHPRPMFPIFHRPRFHRHF